MQCPGKLQKQAAMMVFHACMTNARQHLPVNCHVSLTMHTPYVSLTCACGAGCILRFNGPQTVGPWELLSSTEQISVVRGLIATGTCMLLAMPFSRTSLQADPALAKNSTWPEDVAEFVAEEVAYLSLAEDPALLAEDC